ncbi:hypothetical protein V8F06_014824 [Rhypophila decipiens]
MWSTKYEIHPTEHTSTPILQEAVPLNSKIPENRAATNEHGADTVAHLQQEWKEQTPVTDPCIATSASSYTRLPAQDTLQHSLHASTLGYVSLQPPTSTPSQAQLRSSWEFRPRLYTPSRQTRNRRKDDQVQRKYTCGWNGCEKAYSTIGHLNTHIALQSHGEKRTAKYTRRRPGQPSNPGFQTINHSDRDEPATSVPGSDTRNRSESGPSGFQDTVDAPQGNRAPTLPEQDSNLTELSVDAGTKRTFLSLVMNNMLP